MATALQPNWPTTTPDVEWPLQIDGWFGGLIDGDGSICIQRRVTNFAKYHARGPTYTPLVIVTNTDGGAVRLFQRRFGGSVYHRQPHSTMCRAIYMWRLGGVKNMVPFLRHLLPYLFVKRQQATLVLEFCELPWLGKRRVVGRSADEIATEARYWQMVSDLKHT